MTYAVYGFATCFYSLNTIFSLSHSGPTALSQSYPIKSWKLYFGIVTSRLSVILYFKLGGQVGPEPSSPPGTAQVDGTLAQWAQLLRALAPGAGPPPGRKESMPRRMAGSQGSSHLPICWGSLAQEETQVKHPTRAALPLRELTGEGALSPTGAKPLPSEGCERLRWLVTTSLPWDQVVLGCATAGNLGSCLSRGHANIWSPQAFVQLSGPPAVTHLAYLKRSQPPLEILSLSFVCLFFLPFAWVGSNSPAVEMTFTQGQLILHKQKRFFFFLKKK